MKSVKFNDELKANTPALNEKQELKEELFHSLSARRNQRQSSENCRDKENIARVMTIFGEKG